MTGSPIDQIVVSDLHNDDQIVMETGRSVYTFTITDHANRRGMLVGGKLDKPRDAVFSGSLLADQKIWDAGIRTGSRVTFFLVVPHELSGFSQVMTSPLVGLRLVRRPVEQP